jgi:hypothetical protein
MNMRIKVNYSKPLAILLLFLICTIELWSQGNTCGTAAALPINTSCTYAASNITGAHTASGLTPGFTCYGSGSTQIDIWYTFTGNGNQNIIRYLPAAGFDPVMQLYSGACGSLTQVACADAGGSGSLETITFNSVAATTYYVRIVRYSGGTMNGQICGYTILPPANDNCTAAIGLTVNPDLACGSVTAGTVLGATASAQANACAGTADDDVWYSFVATATSHRLELSNVVGSSTDMMHNVYGGTCAAIGAPLSCSDPDISTVAGLTIGNTYYVRVYTYNGASNPTTTFNICVGTVPPPPPNDNCAGAISLTPGNCTTTTTGYTTSATQSQVGCTGTANDDVWYKFVANSTSHQVDVFGSGDLVHQVFSGTCGTLTSLACSDPNTTLVTGLTIGNTYYIRVYGFNAGSSENFSLCVKTLGPCNTPQNEDFCADPAILTAGATDWNGSTSLVYTSDQSGNLGSFCGTIENNSWYKFVAGATTEVFDFSFIGNCGSGVQAAVYDITRNGNNCCTAFNLKSNCINALGSGIVTATTLTIGNEYVLLVDGVAGDVCDFTLKNWAVSNVLLSDNLNHFFGNPQVNSNRLHWETSSDVAFDHFLLEKSTDGKTFQMIGSIKADPNKENVTYQFDDIYISSEITYYRLKMYYADGSYQFSDKIGVFNKFNAIQTMIYPNPFKDGVTIESNHYLDNETEIPVEIVNHLGTVISHKKIPILTKKLFLPIDPNLELGIYYVKIYFPAGTEIYKIIKSSSN